MVKTFKDSRRVKVATGALLLRLAEEEDKKLSWNREEIDTIIRDITARLRKHGFKRTTKRVSGYGNTTGAKTYRSRKNSLIISVAPFRIARGYYQLAISTNFIQRRIPYDILLSKKHGKRKINEIITEYCKLGNLPEEKLDELMYRI